MTRRDYRVGKGKKGRNGWKVRKGGKDVKGGSCGKEKGLAASVATSPFGSVPKA